jgi:hypothetical protein
MTTVTVLPAAGEVLFDARDGDRSLRVSWHPADDLCVMSIWRGGRCAATFQLARTEAPVLIDSLVEGLALHPSMPWSVANYSEGKRLRWRLPRQHRSSRPPTGNVRS